MVQIAIDPFINVRAMIELLHNVLPDRKDVDMHMINNVRIRTSKKKLVLDSANIQIEPKYFDPTFVNSYIDTADNYTQVKYILYLYLYLYLLFNRFVRLKLCVC